MSQVRGVVVGLQGRQAIVLTPAGEFCRVALKVPAEIGSEVSGRIVRRTWTQLATVAAVMVILLLPGGLAYQRMATTPVAYVGIDINPSLELSVNRWSQVVEVVGLNPEGQSIAGRLHLKGSDLVRAIRTVVNQAASDGFIATGNENLVVLSVTGETGVPQQIVAALDKARGEVEQELSGKGQGQSSIVTVLVAQGKTLRQQAMDEGLSPGKFLVLLEAKASGLELAAREIKEKGIAPALRAIGADVKEIVQKASAEGDYERLAEQYRREKNEDKSEDKNEGEDEKPGKVEIDEKNDDKDEKKDDKGRKDEESKGKGRTEPNPPGQTSDAGRRSGLAPGESASGPAQGSGQDGDDERQEEGEAGGEDSRDSGEGQEAPPGELPPDSETADPDGSGERQEEPDTETPADDERLGKEENAQPAQPPTDPVPGGPGG